MHIFFAFLVNANVERGCDQKGNNVCDIYMKMHFESCLN